MRRSFFLILLLPILILSGCRSAAPSAPKEAFCAVIEGTRGELAFSAEISVLPDGERTIRYTAPDALAGLTATATADGIRVLQGELSRRAESAAGLFLPLDLLTAPAELASTQTKNGETVLSYMDGTEILLNADGTPRAVIRPDIMFIISDFRKTE